MDKQTIIDLVEVLRSQQKLISYLVANEQALVETLSNDPALSGFVDSFQSRHAYARRSSNGQFPDCPIL
jgi:hypothetical protein